MKQIKKPIEIVEKVLGTQKYDNSISYRLSYNCLSQVVEDGYLLYNNLTLEFLILEKNEFEMLTNSNFKQPSILVQKLVERYFLVPVEFEEYKLCDQVREFAKIFLKQEKAVNCYTILPTTACNARCFYCFEAGATKITMDDKTAIAVIDYIEKNCDKNKDVTINWFGGEPLCNIKAIDIISNGLKEKNINFKSRIITNGYLFNEDLIIKAKEKWNLLSVQITLDGLKDTYNQVKNYANGDTNAFDVVMNNIGNLCKHSIRVETRLNLDKHNSNELGDLIDLLYARFGKYKEFMCYVRPIYENVGFDKISHDDNERNEITDTFNTLNNQILKLGRSKTIFLKRKIILNTCQADDKNWRMILPDGNLGFCEHFVDTDFYANIYNDIEKPKWSDLCEIEEKCKKCPAYMSCIRLKKCPGCKHECYAYEQALHINKIYTGMINTYNYYKDSLVDES